MVFTYGSIIEKAPLQTYCAALVFCPTESELKRLFWGEQQLPCIKSVSDIERGWDLHRQALTGHDDRVKTIAFSPNGNVLASASKDGTIQFWAIGPIAARGTKQKLIGHYRGIYAIAFSPLDGNILASASTDNIVRLWTIDPIAATWVLKEVLTGYDESPKFTTFSPGGEIFVSGSYKTIRLWAINAVTATWELKEERESNEYIEAIGFSPNGKILALVGPQLALLWAIDLATASIMSEESITYEKSLTWVGFRAVAFSPPDGKILALGSDDNTIRLFHIDAVTFAGLPQEMLGTLIGHNGRVNAIAFSPSDSKILASASDDKTIRLWAINPVTANGECIQELTSHNSPVTHVAFSPLNGKILASASYDNTVRLWTIDSTTITTTKSEQKHTGHDDFVTAIAFSPDGKVLASASNDETIQLWAIDPILATGVSKDTLTGHSGPIRAVAFSPTDGRILASASNDGTIRIWTVDPMAATGQFKQVLTDNRSQVYIVTFSPDGKTLASASQDGTIRLWVIDPMTATWVPVMKIFTSGYFSYYRIYAIAFSPDCRMLAAALSLEARRTWVRVWTIEPATRTIERVEELDAHGSIRILSFSEDGGYIKTNMGYLPLPGYNKPIPDQDLSCQVYADKDWIFRHKKRLLWLPPEYRPTCEAFYNNIFVLGHHSGRVTFIGFDFITTQL